MKDASPGSPRRSGVNGRIVQISVSPGGVPKMAVPAAHVTVPGAIGENVTVQGLEWSAVTPGCHLRLGESVVLQVTRFTSPCTNIMPVFKGGDFTRVSEKRHPGWSRVYARVLATGSIRQGDPVRLLRAPEVAEVTAAPSR